MTGDFGGVFPASDVTDENGIISAAISSVARLWLNNLWLFIIKKMSAESESVGSLFSALQEVHP